MDEEKKQVNKVIESLHIFASGGRWNDYFALFHKDAVFLGTDDTERWQKEEFEKYARKTDGWNFKKVERNISLDAGATFAWFDEKLNGDQLGRCRGTGVLIKYEGQWKIIQYNLTISIPNEIAISVVKMIKQLQKK